MAAAADSILNSSPSALALSPLQRVHAAAFIDAHDALGLAVTCYPMHLLPLNSTGVGGVAFSFVESVEWLRLETVQDYDVYAGKIEAASRQVEEAIVAMREGMRRGWLQAAAVVQRVEEQVSQRRAPMLLLPQLFLVQSPTFCRSTQPCNKPPLYCERRSATPPAPCPPQSTTASTQRQQPSSHPSPPSSNSSRCHPLPALAPAVNTSSPTAASGVVPAPVSCELTLHLPPRAQRR